MPMIDVFKGDAFHTVSLTDAFIKRPHVPGRLSALRLFRENGITQTTVVVEEKSGVLSLITSSPRGGPASSTGAIKRTARSFVVPHFERDSEKIMADEVQGVRAFGSETEVQTVQSLVTERMDTLRPMHEATLEYQRAGAIQGKIYDGDGTLMFNLFTEFGVAQQSAVMDPASADMRNDVIAWQRLSENELGGDAVTGYRAFCGNDFFDAFIGATAVKNSLQYQESRLLRTDVRAGFEYGGAVWENYPGSVGGTPFFQTDEAFLVPVGPPIFVTKFAPADFMETANTIGLPLYAKIVTDQELNRWAKVHTQSNPLSLCLRPRAVIKLTLAT